MAYPCLKDTFQKSKIKSNDRISLRHINEIKLTNKWSQGISDNTPLYSLDNVTKAVKRLPSNLLEIF